jgi:hypothetical protein
MGAYPYLEEVINRLLGTEKIGYSVFAANILQEKLYKKSKPATGNIVTYPIAKNKSGTAKVFTVYGASDTATYQQPDMVQMLQFDWTVAADFLRISEIQLNQASGKEALIPFLESQIEIVVRSLKDVVSDQIFNGNGVSPNAAGLLTAISYSTTYGGKTRLQFPALIPQLKDARDVNQVLGSGTGTLVFTNGSNVVTEGTANIDAVAIYAGGYLTAPDGNRYLVVASPSSGGAANQLTIFPAYQGTTVTSNSWTYTGAFYPSSTYGGSGVLTIEKINRVMALCSDGDEQPTDVIFNSFTYSTFLNLLSSKGFLLQTQVKQIGAKSINYLNYNGADFYIDNHIPEGVVLFLNADYVHLTPLKGYENIQLSKAGLTKDTSGTRVASLVGDVVATFAVGVNGVNRCGGIINISG